RNVTGVQTCSLPILFEIGQEVFGGIVEILTSVVDGFQGAGGEVNMLKAIFMGLNPVASIAKEVLVSFGPQLAEGFSQIASMVIRSEERRVGKDGRVW